MQIKSVIAAAALASMAAMPQMSFAQSSSDTGTPASTTADLNFQIVIPRFLFFQVGSAGATVDLVDFDFTGSESSIGNAVPYSATAGSPVTVVIRTNSGNDITITEGGCDLTSGLNTIGCSRITTATADGDIPGPQLTDAGVGTGTGTVTAGTDDATCGGVGGGSSCATDTWTFTYDNDIFPAAGTYTGTVTYTASTP